MIIQVRGTNGSGKSEAVRRFAALAGGLGEPVFEDGKKRSSYYLHEGLRLATLGHYGCQCGGADRLRFSEVRGLALRLHGEGWRVLTESMLFSVESKQTLLMLAEVPDVRAIFINVTADQAIRNIYSRREKTGNRLGSPLQEQRVRDNAACVEKMRLKLSAAGVLCRRMGVDQAARTILGWLS